MDVDEIKAMWAKERPEIEKLASMTGHDAKSVLKVADRIQRLMVENAALKAILEKLKRDHRTPRNNNCAICQAIAKAEEVCGAE